MFGADKEAEQTGTWEEPAGRFVGAVLDSAGLLNKPEETESKPNYTPWLIGGGVAVLGIAALLMVNK